MKKKIIVPVLITLWITGIVSIGYATKLLDQLSSMGALQTQLLTEFKIDMLYRGTLFLLIATIAIYLIVGGIIEQITKAIAEFGEEAKLFAKGEYRHSVRCYTIPELEHLAHAFDSMGENLYRTIRKLKYQKSKAESILTHLDQGILVLDKEGYILEMNQVGEEMLKINGVIKNSSHIKDILRDNKCNEMVNEAIKNNVYSSCEVSLGDNIFYIKARPIEEQGIKLGYIVTIQDITNIRKLEEIRYQFVSNVTHEIKTPLTSIQGFVETLKDGAIENKTMALRFLDIIDIEAKRLYRLIQDILLLSEIENMDNIYTESTSVSEVVEDVIELMREEARKKEINIVFEKQNDLVLPCMNRDHMKQTILNLVSNAVRYTDRGQITVITQMKEDRGIIQVQDTGIGIPEESVNRIFERFYRVDNSRSRKSGGTGLGLSIVKHMVGLYKGRIFVESEYGKGSSFIMEFPIQRTEK